MTDYMDTVKTVGVAMIGIALVAVVATAIINPLTALAGAESGIEFPSGDVEIDGVDDDSDVDVRATTGDALYLDGDGHVDAPATNVTDGNWSATATAALDADANQNATYTVTGAENATVLVQYYEGNWSAIYYDSATGDSAQALVDAPTPTQQTTLVATWNDTSEELHLSADDARSDTGTLTAQTPDRAVANDWYGMVDEVRYINETLSTSQTSTYHDDPINPLASADHNLRLMVDEGEGDSTRAYYAGDGATAAVIDGGWTAGVDDPGLVEGTDFEISTNPLTISIVEGGYLDGAPVMYVLTDGGAFASLMTTVFQTGASALGLLVIGILALGASAVMREFGGGNF